MSNESALETPSLKPCPFCGSRNLDICSNSIQCVACSGQIILDSDDEEILAKAWNRRIEPTQNRE